MNQNHVFESPRSAPKNVALSNHGYAGYSTSNGRFSLLNILHRPLGLKPLISPVSPPPRGLGLLVFMVPFCVYFNTMAPTVYGLDSAELATGACTLGIIHSPGAPLFLLVGRLFCYLPFGDVGWRVNLVSVMAGSLTAFFVYAAMSRVTGRIWIGVVTAWLLAASYYVWVWTLVAELYAPHLCIVSALLWLVVKWRDTGRSGFLWSAGALAGLGMGNHTAIVLIGPGLAWLVLTSNPMLSRKLSRLLGPSLAAVAGFLAVFLYIPIRHAAHPAMDYVRDYFPEVNLLSLRGWIWMIRGGMFESLFFSVPLADIGGHLRRLAVQVLANYGALAAALALLGAMAALAGAQEHRHFAVACLLLFVFHAGFYLAYGALDAEWMYSVCYLVLALFFGLGMTALAEHVSSANLLTLLSGVLVLRLVWFNVPYVNLSGDRSARVTGETILAALEPYAVFVGMWEHVPILEYLQIVEQRRPDVRLVNGVFVGPSGVQQIAHAAHAAGNAVYTTATNLFSADFTFTHLPEALCYRVTKAAATRSEKVQ